MNLDESMVLVKACAERMNQVYGKTVFDEWAVISLNSSEGKILAYLGPRKDDFQRNFAHDLGELRQVLLTKKHGLGDFEFARHGLGTHFEAFLVMGDGLYLICNNTSASMEDIASDSRWLNAQVPFLELSDKMRSNPLVSRF